MASDQATATASKYKCPHSGNNNVTVPLGGRGYALLQGVLWCRLCGAMSVLRKDAKAKWTPWRHPVLAAVDDAFEVATAAARQEGREQAALAIRAELVTAMEEAASLACRHCLDAAQPRHGGQMATARPSDKQPGRWFHDFATSAGGHAGFFCDAPAIRAALATDAGRDFVPRAELEDARSSLKAVLEAYEDVHLVLDPTGKIPDPARARMAELEAAKATARERDDAWSHLAHRLGLATGHGDTGADMADEIAAQIEQERSAARAEVERLRDELDLQRRSTSYGLTELRGVLLAEADRRVADAIAMCCRAVCSGCRAGYSVSDSKGVPWHVGHGTADGTACQAAAIRQRGKGGGV